ncbi:uncharacterized protein LOC132333580 [Haemorhous mexicanus]|uniref:uncharacterized protein LOC132333580 n=1 Tax=Haemorhous mexicanus TaxID=30427 RepID=UPI0028BEBF40|nr:uncharacterized protein LOC132333580 [Haemorhous mexicanus]
MAAAGGGGRGSVGLGPSPETPPSEEAPIAAAPPGRPAAPAGPEPRRKRRRVWGRSPRQGPAGARPATPGVASRCLTGARSRPQPSRGTVPRRCPALPSPREPVRGPADPK